MTAQPINITLGTAGHIDHGKTVLTKMLTGCDTDHLKAEKERGMSIELGFAPCTVADTEVGIVDVPGHEDFIKTMVAGASGMDGVILVVAADDGVMPQTREHLDILTLLGIRHGLVALTKIDRVEPERRDAAARETRDLLAGTFLEAAPVLPVSNLTGEGYPDFLEALSEMVRSIQPKNTEGVFRLPIERTFSVKGYGTVVTGIPVSGSLATGDEVVLLPQGLAGRVAGLEVYGRAGDRAMAGQCAALQLRHWDHRVIRRGDVITVPGYFEPAAWLVCALRLLADEPFTLRNASELKFHTGTSEVTAAVYLLEGDEATAGQECLVQVKPSAPLVAGPGDAFIVRTLSPVRTVGGGWIIETEPRRLKRTRPGLVEDLRERRDAARSVETFIEYCIRRAGGVLVGEAEVSARAKAPPKLVRRVADRLAGEGRIIRTPSAALVHAEAAGEAERQARDALAAYHQRAAESPGMTPDDLAEALGIDSGAAGPLIEFLKARGAVAERSGRLSLPDHTETFDPKDRKLIEAVESLFRRRLFNPPNVDEAAAAAAASADEATRIVGILVEHERLVRVDAGLLFHAEAITEARSRIVAHIRAEGQLESVKFKYLLDTTRKFAIPLLDYFDRIGVTQRVGYTRYLRR